MDESPTISPYISAREAADFWRVSIDTIYRWAVKFHWGRDFNPGGGIVFNREDAMKSGKPRRGERRAA